MSKKDRERERERRESERYMKGSWENENHVLSMKETVGGERQPKSGRWKDRKLKKEAGEREKG